MNMYLSPRDYSNSLVGIKIINKEKMLEFDKIIIIVLEISDTIIPIGNYPQLLDLNHTPGVLTLRLNIDTAPINAINNDACGIEFRNFKLKFI